MLNTGKPTALKSWRVMVSFATQALARDFVDHVLHLALVQQRRFPQLQAAVILPEYYRAYDNSQAARLLISVSN